MSATRATTVEQGGWIISARQDLLWFQGAALAGLALLGVFLALPPLSGANYAPAHPAVLALLLWGIVFDATHVWGMYARTYFSGDAQSRSGLPGPAVWGLLLVGPALALADAAWFTPGPSLVGQAGALFRHFLVFAYLWAFWHLVRQHYGLLVLYRRRAGDSGVPLDAWFLWIGSLYPYLRFSLSDAYLHSGLPHPLPASWFDLARGLLDISFVLALLTLAALRLRQRRVFRFGPKHLFLSIVVGFHLLVFGLLDNLLVITAVLTIFHDLQYHRIVWQYERGRGRVPMGSPARYLALGMAFGVFWYGARVMGPALADSDLLLNLLLGLGWGVAFHHYYVDSRIWKVRRHPAVAATLDAGAQA